MIHVTTTTCLLCCISIEGTCATIPLEQIVGHLLPPKSSQLTPVLAATPYVPSMSYENALDALKNFIKDADKPVATTRQFFQAFLDHLNLQNGTSITLEEAYCQLREQKGIIPIEYQETMLMGIHMIEAKSASAPFVSTPSEVDYVYGIQDLEWQRLWDLELSDIKELWSSAKDKFLSWLGVSEQELQRAPLKHLTAAIGEKPERYMIFALIVVGLTVVAMYNPPALAAATEAMIKAAAAIFG